MTEEEHIIWIGGPNLGQFLIRVTSKLAVVWVLFGAALSCLAWLFARHSAAYAVGGTLVWGLLILLSGIPDARGISYTITNRRVIKRAKTYPAQTAPLEIPIATAAAGRLIEFAGGCGTIDIIDGLSLDCIPNAREVFDLIRTASGIEAPAEWMSDPFAGRLAPGETYRWKGTPDIGRFNWEYRAYNRARYAFACRVALICAIILAVIGGLLHGLEGAIILATIPIALGIVLPLALRMGWSDTNNVAASVRYAVTNRRALIFIRELPSASFYLSIDLSTVTVALTTQEDGVGTIEFEGPVSGWYHERNGGGLSVDFARRFEYAFFHIPTPQAAMDVIETVRHHRHGMPPLGISDHRGALVRQSE